MSSRKILEKEWSRLNEKRMARLSALLCDSKNVARTNWMWGSDLWDIYYPPPWGNETATRSSHRDWDDYVGKKREKAKGIKEYGRKIEGIRKTTGEKQDSCTDIYMQGTTGFPVLFTWSPFGLFFFASGARQRAPFTFLNNNNVYMALDKTIPFPCGADEKEEEEERRYETK